GDGGPAADGLRCSVDGLGGGEQEADPRPAAADRLDDGPELDGADGGARQERGEQEVVPRADDGGVVGPGVEPGEQPVGGEPGAEDHQPGAGGHGALRSSSSLPLDGGG